MKNFGAWVKDTVLRSIKTAAQSAVALVTANTAGLTSVSWVHVGDVAGLAFVVCVLHNLSTLKVDAPPAVADPLPAIATVQVATPATTFPTTWVPVPDLVDSPDSVPAVDQTA